MRSRVPRIAALLVGVWGPTLPVWAEPPVLESVAPQALRPGKSVTLDLRGPRVGKATGLRLSCPVGKAEFRPLDPPDANRTTVAVELPADVPPGPHLLRTAGPDGVSGAVPFLVDDIPTGRRQREPEPLTPATAQPLTAPIAVEAGLAEGNGHYFKLELQAGQRVWADVRAERFGSKLDPCLQWWDAAGRKPLRFVDDSPALGRDLLVPLEVKTPETVLLQLRDARYDGGGAYRYRLRLATQPPVATVFPTGAIAGRATKFTPLCDGPHTFAEVERTFPAETRGAAYVSFRAADGAAGWGAVLVGEGPELAEPLAGGGEPVRLPVPCGWSGRLLLPRETDRVRLELVKGQKVTLRVRCGELGSPVEPILTVRDAAGKTVAVSEPNASEGTTRLNFTAEAAGEYEVLIRDLAHRGGPTWVYRLEVDPTSPQPMAALHGPAEKAAAVEVLNARLGEPVRGRIVVKRDGIAGELPLWGTWEGTEPVRVGTIPDKRDEAAFELPFPPEAAAGSVLRLRLEVEAGGRKIPVETDAPLRARFPRLGVLPDDRTRVVEVGVLAAAKNKK